MSRTLTNKRDIQYTNVGHYSRRREPREIMFYCECCQEVKTEMRLPAATPKYCQTCAPEIRRKQATERQQRHRQAVKDGTAVKTLPTAEKKRFHAQMKQIRGNATKNELDRVMEVIKYIDYLKEHDRTEQANELSKIINENVKQGYDTMLEWVWSEVRQQYET